MIALEADGVSHPYIVVTVGSYKKKTRVIRTTLNPKWRIGSEAEKFKLYVASMPSLSALVLAGGATRYFATKSALLSEPSRHQKAANDILNLSYRCELANRFVVGFAPPLP